jgi:hypothetical protein
MTPFVFLVGCARSGTTLLQRVADAHPRIAITPETHWITDSFRDKQWLGPQGRVTPDQVASMLEHKRFRQFEISREQFLGLLGSGEPVSYCQFLEGLFGLYSRIKGKGLVGNKTPAYVRRIPTLHSLWPEAKFVHLIRDGRDVCLSVLNWNHYYKTAGRYSIWTEDPVTTTALWWERKVCEGREGGQLLGRGLYYEMCYEGLISQPENACARLCDFLRLPYDGAMLRFHEGRTRKTPGLDAKKAWLPITPGLRNWRSQMPPEDVERFEAAAGELLNELGYRRAFPRPSLQCLEQAARLRETFIREVHSRDAVVRESS